MKGKGRRANYADKALLPFPTLDDSGRKAHKLYRVQSIPTVFLIDKDGKIIRFLRGGRSPDSLRAASAASVCELPAPLPLIRQGTPSPPSPPRSSSAASTPSPS